LNRLRRLGSQDKHQVRGIGYKKEKAASDSCLPPRWKIQKSGAAQIRTGPLNTNWQAMNTPSGCRSTF
jgi:hypothetical protein